MHMLSVLFHACTKCVDVIEPVVCGIQVSGGTAGIIVVCVCGGVFLNGRRHGADEFDLYAHAFCVVRCSHDVC
jgi:hypothetical protein